MIKLRVVDTATFIQAGKQANGDLYDYSQSVFSGWRKPVLIGCNRCGKLINLKNAGSHYLKGCGCKACNRDRPSPCKVCGVSVSSKVYHKQGFRCNECNADHQFSRSSPWASVIKRQVHRHCKRLSPWEVKCKGAMGMVSRRKLSENKKQGMPSSSWEETIGNQIRRCLCDQNVQAWERKCKAAFKTLHRRKMK